ncbi:ABC transporter permease [Rugosimonospora africana]|uniref:Transport permease protein n=1 Tax=Rugosimonospora africana TaxID=556532 RepID=A0A8J3QSA4_9ACTN|nr:ABC transporter permease [Rugosimonospora africana]GIH14810.1 transport permease protein [Rugosimonospora africana]
MMPLAQQGFTLAWRSLVPLKNSPGQLIGYVLQPVLMVAVFVYLFGGAAAGGDRHTAVLYALPGVLAQSALMATIATGVNLNTDLHNGVFDRFRSLPIARAAPLLGRVLADLCLLGVSVGMALLVGLVVGFRIGTGPVQVVVAVGLILAIAVALSWGSALLGLVSKTPAAMQVTATAVIMPLTLGSSAFLPIGSVPGWLQAWMRVNPASHLADAVRGLLVGHPYDSHLGVDILVTLGWVAVMLAVFVPLAVRAYRRRI